MIWSAKLKAILQSAFEIWKWIFGRLPDGWSGGRSRGGRWDAQLESAAAVSCSMRKVLRHPAGAGDRFSDVDALVQVVLSRFAVYLGPD